ncbi:hypothetical protein Desaci_3142 [Desulfosporosinus acidiphilus SJ4]|uniref:Uncharacterized protein n=1 Tax=Desulfosporosinus acidiphilus (strain DSM 22704 / JCM 16185 / SJ4) TaxID=646529 RepID=I4D8C2_DESAJ|nr:hypothetical protein [Desulfosporosinus acidiphilus]AFM42046.1 hypothetical protein Desaci_3142 [Desulfosporosinus acidiphilus SJ4]
MRWLWRGILLIAIAYFLKTYTFSEPKAFISWPEGKNWVEKINFEVKHWQSITQGLPESLEVEVRQFLKDFRASGSGEEV